MAGESGFFKGGSEILSDGATDGQFEPPIRVIDLTVGMSSSGAEFFHVEEGKVESDFEWCGCLW